jgi:Protein of unknown function (DUF2948)
MGDAGQALKLRADDPEDLGVVAAVLQDALVPVCDMEYLADERRFVMVANRFKWEGPERGATGPFERTLTGVCFDGVAGVKTRGFGHAERERILNLLTIEAAPQAVTFAFSDGALLRLDVDAIRCHVQDLGEPWPTPSRPDHPLDPA